MFTREESVRKQLVNRLNESLENLNKSLYRYCFLKILSEEIPLLNLKNDVIIQKASMLKKNLDEILSSDTKFKKHGEEFKQSIDALKEETESLIIGRLVTESTSKLSQWSLKLGENKKVFSNDFIAKVFDVDKETIIHAEKLIEEFQNRMKSDISLEDIIWASSNMSELKKMISGILQKATVEIISEKLGLTRDEAEKVKLLVSGEKVSLVEMNDSLLRKIREIFGNMVKITITG
jgi:hypothetical protein